MLRKDLKRMMAGRHLWPPSCRAVGAARSPSLLVGKEPCLPSHHHHQLDLDPSPQIKCPSFLGLGMMGRELKAAGRYIGSPSCGNIPRQSAASAALPVKEPNGHVTSDGGASPSAGALPPSDGGGFPPAGALSPSDGGGGGCPSAGPSSPESWPHPSSQSVLYFRPSPSFLVVEEAGVGARDDRGPPPTGLLVPIYRPDPRLHQQRRPLLAAAGSLPNRPATVRLQRHPHNAAVALSGTVSWPEASSPLLPFRMLLPLN